MFIVQLDTYIVTTNNHLQIDVEISYLQRDIVVLDQFPIIEPFPESIDVIAECDE